MKALHRDGSGAVETGMGDARKGEHDGWALMLRVEGKDGVECFGAAYRPELKRDCGLFGRCGDTSRGVGR